MLSPTGTTNVAQKHLKVLLTQWQLSKDASVNHTLEMSFVLMMNRALGSLLLEVVPELANHNKKLDGDFLSLITQPFAIALEDQMIIQLTASLAQSTSWLASWHESWQQMNAVAIDKPISKDNLIATATVEQDRPEIEQWYHHFNELVDNLRAQNEYC
ncbi:MAG: hypothetical protein ACI9DO_003693 [Reinekea sp.]|jgi:hypothetical protein|uniref:DUF6586 family protein n=1 Tax=Reinekea sp. TaxID=1970455 RepID=UPI00398A0E8A